MHLLIITLSIIGGISRLPSSCAWIYVDDSMQVDHPSPGIPWPYPQEMQISQDVMTLNPMIFTLTTNAEDCDIVRAALDRYKNLLFLNGKEAKFDRGNRMLLGLDVNIDYYWKGYCGYPALGDDESYSISMKYEDQTVYLKSETVWGALRGLETFSQLVHVNEDTKTYHINVTNIKDKPRFSHRGVLLDTARHYLPTDLLKQNLDAMAYNKLNVFHWHIVDDESFPLQSLMYPNLTTLGAFSQKLIYTQTDVKEIVAYARLRGIRVIPEFDTPAHTRAMGIAFPHLMTTCSGDQKPDCQYRGMTTLNPTLDQTYHVLQEIIRELKTLFADEYIHLGMNDIDGKCCVYSSGQFSTNFWRSLCDGRAASHKKLITHTRRRLEWCKQHRHWKKVLWIDESRDSNSNFKEYKAASKMNDDGALESFYATSLISIASDMGFKGMVWQDVIEKNSMSWNTMKNTIVQIRKDPTVNKRMDPWFDYAKAFGEKEYKMIISSCWNLNYPIYGAELQTYYECDPEYFYKKCSKCYPNLVQGGEAILWGDLVDSTNLISRLWPSASAMAERLWSSTKQNKYYEARYRLDQQRCRMRQRGIGAGPVLGGYCGDIDKNSTLYATSFQSNNYELCPKTCNCSEKCECPNPVTDKPGIGTTSAKPNGSKFGIDFTQRIVINSTANTGHFANPVIQLAAVLVILLCK